MIFHLSEAQKRRFLCKTDLQHGRDTDLSGFAAGVGGACVNCEGCSTPRGELGLVGERTRLVGDIEGVNLVWACPGCGGEVTENTTPLKANIDAAGAEADPLCCRCRRKQTPAA